MEQKTFWIALKALIQNADGNFLILFKSDSEEVNPHDFDIPDGRVERGEKLEEAIGREVREECWLEIELQRVSRVWGFTQGGLHFWKSKEEILCGELPRWLQEKVGVM